MISPGIESRARIVVTPSGKPAALSHPTQCSKCQTTAKKIRNCEGCLSIGYCSKECQHNDWPDHRLDCIKVLLNSWGFSQVYKDARKGVPNAQIVIGLLYLYGFDLTSSSEEIEKAFLKLKAYEEKDQLPYASLAYGIILAELNRSEMAERFLENAAEGGLVQGSARLCLLLEKKYEKDPHDATLQRFLKVYLTRFKNMEQACEELDLTQHVAFNAILLKAMRPLPPDTQLSVMQQRMHLTERGTGYLKTKSVSITFANKGERPIKPNRHIARHFLEGAASQNHPLAREFLAKLTP